MSVDQCAPFDLTACEARALIQAGELQATELLQSCLNRIAALEPNLKAFASVTAEDVQSLVADSIDTVKSEEALLAGIPIGVKDVIATAQLSTGYNSPAYEGFQCADDAACVAALRAEGAVVLGKTATVEFASLGRKPATVNPHNHSHTPGGSSSGSAAAVAARMVPLALGTQTGGSVIRPAAFCGIAAMKPTFGTVSVHGLFPYAPSLDTIGWMSRSVADLELLARALRVSVPGITQRKRRLRIGVYHTPYWQYAQEETRQALESTIETLSAGGIDVESVSGPPGAESLNEAQDIVMHGEGRATFLGEYLRHGDSLHPEIRTEVENAKKLSVEQLRWSYDHIGSMRPQFDALLADYDAWLTPATPGEAPPGLEQNGLATFNRLWTALHVPCITLPGFSGPNRLPVGIQLVAGRYRDAELLAVSARVESLLREAGIKAKSTN